MDNFRFYLDANQRLLWQLKAQLSELLEIPEPIYRKAVPIIGGASIGAHLRHILDFYQAFVLGVDNGLVDYDNRARNHETEQLLSKGLYQIEQLVSQLNHLNQYQNISLKIRSSVAISAKKSYLATSLVRELQMLHSHTTHHMAIIAMIFQLNQLTVSANFGKAPSTIDYEQKTSAPLGLLASKIKTRIQPIQRRSIPNLRESG